MFTSAFPIIATRNLTRVLAFYRDLFDGKITYQFPPEGEPGYVALDIGSSHLGLALDPEASPGRQRIALWIYAGDCDVAVARLRAADVPITEPPTTQPWGERTARVTDPDGNEIVIGSPALTSPPEPDTYPESAR